MNNKLPNVARLLAFMQERHRIYTRRFVEKRPPPWTKDPILKRFRFCNVYRELDRVTIWIREHIREPYADHPNLWFMLCVARQINWPNTLAALIADPQSAWPTNNRWRWERMRAVMRKLQSKGAKIYTGAYMLRGPIQGDSSGFQDKPNYTTQRVLAPVWQDRNVIQPDKWHTLQQAASSLSNYHGWGDFLIAQVIADVKHTRYLKNAPDWWDWIWLGPGSRRGLNRVLDRPITGNFTQYEAHTYLVQIRDYIKDNSDLPRLCLQDLQNAHCEFDKYERVRLGEGRPRALFTSGRA